jgi:hypothetical protein
MRNIKYIYLVVIVAISSCQKDVNEFLRENKTKIFSVSVDTNSIEADGVSVLKITALLEKNSDANTVTFKTTNGTFIHGTATITRPVIQTVDGLFAEASLVSSVNMDPYVEINVSAIGTHVIDTTFSVKFTKALPQLILMQAQTLAISNQYNSTFAFETYLLRDKGHCSTRQFVQLKAYKLDNTEYGSFFNNSTQGSDSVGLIKSSYVLPDTLYTGPLIIRGTAVSYAGFIQGTMVINIY